MTYHTYISYPFDMHRISIKGLNRRALQINLEYNQPNSILTYFESNKKFNIIDS